ncbi:hypothetical protein ACQKO6_17865 [Pseudomonas monteilii]
MDNYVSSIIGASVALEAAFAATQSPIQPGNGAMMDNANGAGTGTGEGKHMLDDVQSVFTDEMRVDAAAVVEEWSESDVLDSEEGYGDRLYALIVGTASEGDEDMTDDEADYANDVANLVGDYLESQGVDSGDIDALLEDFDNDVAARVHDVLLDKMPQGQEAMLDAVDKFVHGDDDSMLDATYRKVLAIRDGKKVRVNKRIGGAVRLSAGQKAAVRKMQRKAFSGTAKRKRAKSMRIRLKTIGK